VAIEHGIARRKIDDVEILERILGAMAAEGQKLLAEGIAQRAGDIDVVYVHGYGFPAWHGGPMFRALQQTNEEKAIYA
jgi:3-hydroxyacyl-CoA dehydrogenase